MAKIKVDAIHPEIAARARVLLEQHSVAEAHSAGPGVLAIYKWVLCLCLLRSHTIQTLPPVCSFHTRSHAVQTLPVFVPFTLVPIQ